MLDSVHLQLDYMTYLFIVVCIILLIACAALLYDWLTHRSAKQPGSSQNARIEIYNKNVRGNH